MLHHLSSCQRRSHQSQSLVHCMHHRGWLFRPWTVLVQYFRWNRRQNWFLHLNLNREKYKTGVCLNCFYLFYQLQNSYIWMSSLHFLYKHKTVRFILFFLVSATPSLNHSYLLEILMTPIIPTTATLQWSIQATFQLVIRLRCQALPNRLLQS